MQWPEYIKFTATTALPGTDNPEYLRLGILEEAHEALAAYATWQAAIHGRAKRVLRGDPPHVLQAKTDAEIARRQLAEELGDLAWYVARLVGYDCLSVLGNRQISDVTIALEQFKSAPYGSRAKTLLCEFLSLAKFDIETVISANVAKLTDRKAAGTIQGEGSR